LPGLAPASALSPFSPSRSLRLSAYSAEVGWPGVARQLLTFIETRKAGFLLFAKRRATRAGFAHFAQRSYANTKSKQKKRRPWLLRPSASLRATCGARSSRGLAKLATLRFAQTTRSLIRLDLRSSAHPQGVGEKYQYLKPQGHAMACPCLYLSSLSLVFGSRSRLPRPGWAEERRDKRIRAGVV